MINLQLLRATLLHCFSILSLYSVDEVKHQWAQIVTLAWLARTLKIYFAMIHEMVKHYYVEMLIADNLSPSQVLLVVVEQTFTYVRLFNFPRLSTRPVCKDNRAWLLCRTTNAKLFHMHMWIAVSNRQRIIMSFWQYYFLVWLLSFAYIW